MNSKEETDSSPTVSLDEETIKRWISICKTSTEESVFLRTQIGKALEHEDPSALEFLRRAHEMDPVFIEKGFFRSFMDLLQPE